MSLLPYVDVIKVLSLTTSSRIVVSQNSKVSKVGQQCTALINHVPVVSPNPVFVSPTVRHPPKPSPDVNVNVDVYHMSLEVALTSLEKWYSAGIRQSLAKWSLKQLFTLAVYDLGEASEETARVVAAGVDMPGCSGVLQQFKGNLWVSQ